MKNKIVPLWVVQYFTEEFLAEAETKDVAVELFIEGFIYTHKGCFNKENMKKAILTGVPELPYNSETCFVFQLCLPQDVQRLLGGKLFEMLNELDCLARNIRMGEKKRMQEFFHKGFILSSLLHKLELVFGSKPLQYLRIKVEHLWSSAERNKFHLDEEVMKTLLKAFLSQQVK